MAGMDHARLSMPIGEAMFTQRSIRRFRPDAIPVEDLRLILEAAVRAPNGANRQIARFLVVTDRERLRAFGRLYHEAWWAKRREERGWTRPEDIPPEDRAYRSAMGLAEAMGDVPCVVLAFAVPPGAANSVIPAAQNLMLAARALGIGSVPTTLHPQVMERARAPLWDPGRRHPALLHPARLPGGPLRGQRPPAHGGDDLLRGVGRAASLGLMAPLAEADAAARKAAAPVPVPVPERARQGRGDRPGPGPDLQEPAIRVVSHHHPARVARQALRRLRGNARAVLEDGLPRLLRVRQHRASTWTTTWYRSPGAPGSRQDDGPPGQPPGTTAENRALC